MSDSDRTLKVVCRLVAVLFLLVGVALCLLSLCACSTPQPAPTVEYDLHDLLPQLYQDDVSDAAKGGDVHAGPVGQPTSHVVTGAVASVTTQCLTFAYPRPCPAWNLRCDTTQPQYTWATHSPQFGPPPAYGRWQFVCNGP